MTEKVVLGTRVPIGVANQVENLVEEGKYLNTADFLRVAARREIEKANEPRPERKTPGDL